MSKLITSALLATVLLMSGLGGANAAPNDLNRSQGDREYICKVLQRNCS